MARICVSLADHRDVDLPESGDTVEGVVISIDDKEKLPDINNLTSLTDHIDWVGGIELLYKDS